MREKGSGEREKGLWIHRPWRCPDSNVRLKKFQSLTEWTNRRSSGTTSMSYQQTSKQAFLWLNLMTFIPPPIKFLCSLQYRDWYTLFRFVNSKPLCPRSVTKTEDPPRPLERVLTYLEKKPKGSNYLGSMTNVQTKKTERLHKKERN